MSDAEIGNWILGFFAPLLIALIVQQGWSARLKQVVAFVVVVALSIAVWVYQHEGAFDGQDWRGFVRVLAPVFIASVASYHGLWRRTVAPAIESATTIGR